MLEEVDDVGRRSIDETFVLEPRWEEVVGLFSGDGSVRKAIGVLCKPITEPVSERER